MAATFGAFAVLFSGMMFLVGFSACAIGVSAWPFVVPIMLTFFEEMKDKPRIKLFDALYIAVLVDLANAILLTFFALRQKTINVRDGLYFGALAALPALPSAILSTRYLPQFEELLKQVSGYGLFGFGLIFAVRGLRMHARRLKQEGDEVEPLLRRKGSRGSKSSQGSRGSLDDSDRRASITATPKRLSSSGLPEDIARRGIARYKIIICAAAVAAAGVFAGFVGFGNGMLFATAYIIFLDFEIERAAGTAMLSTAVLMSVVALCYIPEFRPVVLAPYLGVTVGASLVGVVVGHVSIMYCGGIDPLVVNFFVAAVLAMCGIVASLPTWVDV